MPPEIMVISIVGIVFGWMMLRLILSAIFGAERMGLTKTKDKKGSADQAQVKALERQVALLTDRVKVLERITVEEGHSLAVEIERLREPEKLSYGGANDLATPTGSRKRV